MKFETTGNFFAIATATMATTAISRYFFMFKSFWFTFMNVAMPLLKPQFKRYVIGFQWVYTLR